MLIRFSDTVGFTFQGDLACLDCSRDIAQGMVSFLGGSIIPDASVHELISVWAARRMVPAYSVHETFTYDTNIYSDDDLPRPVERDDLGSEERCDTCGKSV